MRHAALELANVTTSHTLFTRNLQKELATPICSPPLSRFFASAPARTGGANDMKAHRIDTAHLKIDLCNASQSVSTQQLTGIIQRLALQQSMAISCNKEVFRRQSSIKPLGHTLMGRSGCFVSFILGDGYDPCERYLSQRQLIAPTTSLFLIQFLVATTVPCDATKFRTPPFLVTSSMRLSRLARHDLAFAWMHNNRT